MAYVDRYGRVWEKGKVVAVRTSSGERKVKDINEADKIIASERRKQREQRKISRQATTREKQQPVQQTEETIKVYIGETTTGEPIYREVRVEDVQRMSKEQLAQRYGRKAAQNIRVEKTETGEIRISYASGATKESYISREFIERATGKKYAGLQEHVPLWQAKQILKQEGIKYWEEDGSLFVEQRNKSEEAYTIQNKIQDQKKLTEEQRIKQEIESYGIPIIPGEKIDFEEKALLKILRVSDKIRGNGKGFIGGIRQAGAEMIAGIGVTGYAFIQLAKRPKETFSFFKKPKELASGTYDEFKTWAKDINAMPTRKKLGYITGFVIVPSAVGKTVGVGIRAGRATKGIRIRGGKLVYNGEVVTGGLIKQKVTGKFRSPKVESVNIAPAGDPMLRAEKPGYVKEIKTIEGEGIKVQIEKRESARTVELNYPVEAELRSYKKGEYAERRTSEYLVATKEGEVRPMLKERRIREEKVEMPLTEERLVATVEERRTIPDIPEERTKIIHEIGVVKTKFGGLPEIVQRQKLRGRLKPIVIVSEGAKLRPPKLRIMPRISLSEKGRTAVGEDMWEPEKENEGTRLRSSIMQDLVQLSRDLIINKEKDIGTEAERIITLDAQKQTKKQKELRMIFLPGGRFIRYKGLKPLKKSKPRLEQRRMIIRRGRRHKIEDVWRIGVKGRKLRKLLFGR